MKLISCEFGGRRHLGLLQDERVVDLSGLPLWKDAPPPDLGVALSAFPPEQILETLRTMDPTELDVNPLENVKIRAPIPRPPLLVAVGRNYREHADEQGARLPDRPLLFSKPSSCVIGPDDAIILPAPAPSAVDVEVELGVVIGQSGTDVSVDEAMGFVFGYTIVNDVSARDVQKGEKQWFRGKSYRSFAPMGPAVVPREALAWDDLQLRARWKGQTMQSGQTSHMIFGVPHLVADVSTVVALEPGMVIATGTPAGVGAFRDPPVFLEPGDFVECEISGIGILSNPVVSA